MASTTAFTYRAMATDDRRIVKGRMEAASRMAVASQLRAQGLMPLEVESVATSGLNREISIPALERAPKAKTLAIFTRQLAGLTSAGLPILRALEILVDQTDDKRLAEALRRVLGDVEGGTSFSDALAKQPRVFPPFLISMVRVGESGGFFAQSLEAVAKAYESEAELQGKIRAATTYPMVVLVVAILAVILMVTFIVPIFKGMFASLGGQLPLPTQILVTLSENMAWVLPLLIVLTLVGVVLWRRNRRTDKMRSIVEPAYLKMPIFGKVMTKLAVARFSRNLSMMLNAGVPLLNALAIVGESANNWAIERVIDEVRESVRQGRTFSEPLEASGIFPPMVSQMIAVGEESGSLPDMLSSIADYYEVEARAVTEQLTSIIEPLLIVVVGIVIGGMVMALYMPIFSIYGELNQSG